MARSWWVVFGALGGLCLLGGVAVLVRLLADTELWSVYALFVDPAIGLVIGGVVGSRVPGMARQARIAFGALALGAFIAFVAGCAFLFLGGSGGGLARFQGKNFAIGAVVGAVAGVLVGGMLGAKTVGRTVGGLGDIE